MNVQYVSDNQNGSNWTLAMLICMGLAFVCLVWGSYEWGWGGPNEPSSDKMEDWGNFGSYLQGAVATPWSLAGVFLIVLAFLGQQQQLGLQREQLEEQRQQFKTDHQNNLDLQALERQNAINGVLRAMRYELEVIGAFYAASAGATVANLKDNEPLLTSVQFADDYFVIYPNNTHIVGQIKDIDLCKSIVTVYNLAKSLHDSFRINNLYYAKWCEEQSTATHKKLTDYVHIVRLQDRDLKRETGKLLAKIDQ